MNTAPHMQDQLVAERRLNFYRHVLGALGGKMSAEREGVVLQASDTRTNTVIIYFEGEQVMWVTPDGIHLTDIDPRWSKPLTQWMNESTPTNTMPTPPEPVQLELHTIKDTGMPYYTCADFPALVLVARTYENEHGTWSALEGWWGIALKKDFAPVCDNVLTLTAAERVARAIGDAEDWDEIMARGNKEIKKLGPWSSAAYVTLQQDKLERLPNRGALGRWKGGRSRGMS